VPWFAVIATAVLAAWTPGPAGTVWAQLVPVPPQARPQAAEDQRADDADERGDDEASGGIAFPTDRRRERQLDQARRLINESRWSDVATLLDGILEADRDFFYQPTAGESTWRSVKSEAARLVAALPPAGREAYELQFRARAERALEQALAANDPAGVVAVARRWFQTPAGRRATLVAAVESLEAGQPLAAAAGLDRLALAADAAAFEPALSVLRAAALWRAGERTAATTVLDGARGRGAGVVRLGGREMPLSYPAGGATDWLAGVLGEPPVAAVRRAQEWWVSRGDSARNAIVESSRPLLVARYRVPLSRHPEESRLLERRRRQAADRDATQWPAGGPLAVDGRLLVRSPLGLLAVDFVTGKRVWLQPAGSTAAFLDNADEMEDGSGRDKVPASVRNVFDDATSGGLASDGRLVFAVEPDPVTVAAQVGQIQARFNGLMVPEDRMGNALAAYDVADRGRQVWRLPRNRADRDGTGRPSNEGPGNPGAGMEPPVGTTAGQYLGAPLPLGEQLFVIVEERGEIRLDVLEAATGDTSWMQPLAVLDEELAVDGGSGRQRRLAGLSPSFAEGVLVCQTGAGAVVAVDLANRTLLWAYGYTRPTAAEGMLLNNMRIRRGINARIVVNGQLLTPGEVAPRSSGWRDATAIIAGGRVVITPPDSDELHCLDLRTGSLVWRRPRGDACQVAGVAGDAVVVVQKHAVDIVALADGKSRLENPVSLGGASPSGRGVLTGSHLFLPLDTPEVVDIDIAQGRIAGRSASRGGAVPGNLVAYRGEIISQGVDSLDVFHQSAALQEQLQTAAVAGPWGPVWAGQLALDSGDVAGGLEMILRARQADPAAVPAAVVSDAMLFALAGQFAAAAPVWRGSLAAGGADLAATASYARQVRIACDGYLRAGDIDNAWWACQEAIALAERESQIPADDGPGVAEDPADRSLSSAGQRWLHGRIADLLTRAPADLRTQIDRRVDEALLAIEAESDPLVRTRRLESFLTIFGSHPAAERARAGLVATLAARLRSAGTGDASRGLLLRTELLRSVIESPSAGDPAGAFATPDVGAAWPLGRVVERRPANGRAVDAARQVRVVAVRVADGGGGAFPGLRLGYDMNNMRLFAIDGFGRHLGDLFDRSAVPLAGVINPLMIEATAIGRVVVIRSGSLLAAFELSGDPSIPNRRLWMLNDLSAAAAELPLVNVGRLVGARGGRGTNVPLGMRVAEPDDPNPREELHLGPAQATGLPVRVGAAVELHDPVTGAVIWERHRVPTNAELFGDGDFLFISPPNGVGATVVSMADGRVIRTADLPPRHQRLAVHGRRIVAIEPLGGEGRQFQARVRLVLIDPVTMARQPLGEYRGEALAAGVGGRIVVVEPGGALTLLDLEQGRVEWTSRIAVGDARPEQLHVQEWEDRLLVFVGRQPTAEEQAAVSRSGVVLPLPQSMTGDSQQPATGSVWAVSLRDGSPLWPAPATILQHALHPQQPPGLPLLVFARQIQGQRGGGQTRLSLLALDKRTGHAVCLDDGIEAQQHLLMGCDVTADPAGHTITLGRGGGEAADRVLEFTGLPIAPRPPYQAVAVQPPPLDLRGSLQRLLERALTPDGGP
jgi:outer membrane protein assembly factor BamB